MYSKLLTRVLMSVLLIALISTPLSILAQDDDEQLATFVSSDNAITFDYPAEWHTEEFMLPGIVFMGNSTEVVSASLASEEPVVAGGLFMGIIAPQAISLMFEGVIPESLEEAMDLFIVTNEAEEGEETEAGEIEEIEINERNALVVPIIATTGEGLVYIIDFDGEYLFISVIAATGEFEDFADTVTAIVETIAYTTPEGVLTFQGDTLSFEYPATWLTFPLGEGSYTVMNDIGINQTPVSGQLWMLINEPNAVSLFSLPEDATPEMVAEGFVDVAVQGEKELSEAAEILIGDYAGIKLDFVSAENEGYVLVLEVEDGVLVIAVSAAVGEIDDYEAEVMALIKSMVYTPASSDE